MSGGRLRRNRPEWMPEFEDGWVYGDYRVHLASQAPNTRGWCSTAADRYTDRTETTPALNGS
jgi:hypothetical protein